jgi:hypothetical protein
MSKPVEGEKKKTEPVLSATERMMVEMQKRKIQAMRMSAEQLELFRDTFVIFDKDGDGTIDSKELSTVLKSMGYNPTIEEIKEMVDQVDSDGSGSIEFLEFLLLMGGILKDVPTDLDLRDAFTGETFNCKIECCFAWSIFTLILSLAEKGSHTDAFSMQCLTRTEAATLQAVK